MRTCIRAYTHTRICAYTRIRIHIRIRVHVYTYTYMYTHIRICVYMYTHICICIHVYVYVCATYTRHIRVYAYAYTRIRIGIYVYAYTYSPHKSNVAQCCFGGQSTTRYSKALLCVCVGGGGALLPSAPTCTGLLALDPWVVYQICLHHCCCCCCYPLVLLLLLWLLLPLVLLILVECWLSVVTHGNERQHNTLGVARSKAAQGGLTP